jgi:hypothetical protein
MQHVVHNRATIRVADRTDISVRVTADEVNLDRFHNRIRKVRLIARTWLALVTVSLGLYLGLPVCGFSQNDQGQNDQGFLDPIVGSWLVHVTVDTYTPTPSFPLPFQFDAPQSFWGNGITLTSDPITGTAYGVWKRSGLPSTGTPAGNNPNRSSWTHRA